MLMGVIFFLTSLSAFIILAEKLEVKISFDKICRVEIHSTILAVELIFSGTGKRHKNKRKKRYGDRKKLLLKVFSRSSLKISNLSYGYRSSLPHIDALSRCAYYAVTSALIAYFSTLFKKFEYSNINIICSEHNNSILTFNAKLEITLLEFMACLIQYSFYAISNALKSKLRSS